MCKLSCEVYLSTRNHAFVIKKRKFTVDPTCHHLSDDYDHDENELDECSKMQPQ